MKISVCMASYNGARYIRTQLVSILNQLGPEDQLVVVDDASTDDTVQIIKDFNDSRIQLHINAVNMGAAWTFDRGLHLAQGDLIFLSDQDDRWQGNKISVIRDIFASQDVDLVVHDAVIVDGHRVVSNSLFKLGNSSSGVIKNIISNTFTGCCMAFRKNILMKVLPIPGRIGLYHDAWIGIMAEYYGYKVSFIDAALIEFNRHDGNASALKRRGIVRIISERIIFISEILFRIIKTHFNILRSVYCAIM